MSGRVARRLRMQRRREFEQFLDNRELVIVGERETAVSVPGIGALFISRVDGVTIIEGIAHSGPGVEHRKARLDALMREAGLGHLVDERDRRVAEAA